MATLNKEVEAFFGNKGAVDLEVKSVSSLFQALQNEAPRTGAAREIVSNGITAGASTVEVRPVKIGRTRKAVFIDNGTGLDAEGLYNLKNIYGSNKGEGFFGTGVRVLTAATNELGVVFQSRVEGIVRHIRFFTHQGQPQIEAGIGEYASIDNLPDGNYTAVILLGNSANQDTFKIPYGNLTAPYPFKEQIETRFFFKPKNCDIVIDGESYTPLSEQLKASGKQYIVKSSKIDYIYTVGKNIPNISGVVFEDELHYPSKGKRRESVLLGNATDVLAALDAQTLPNEVSVVVVLKKGYKVKPGQHRTTLHYDGAELNLEHFKDGIKRHQPKEVKEYIAAGRAASFKGLKTKSFVEDYADFDKVLLDDFRDLNEEGVIEDPTIVRKVNPVPVPKKPVYCPECGRDITNLKGGERCPTIDCPYVKPIRPTPEPTDKKRKSFQPLEVQITKDVDYRHGEHAFYEGGDVLYLNPDSKVIVKLHERLAGNKIPRDESSITFAKALEAEVRSFLRGLKDISRDEAGLIIKACTKLALKTTVDAFHKKITKG